MKHAQRTQLARAPVRYRFHRIVDGRVDVPAHQLGGDITAALEGYVGQLLAEGFAERRAEQLILLLGAGAAHAELVVGCAPDRIQVLIGGLVRRVRVDPEHELIQRQHRNRRQVAVAEGNTRGERRGEQVRERDHDLVRIAGAALHLQEALAASSARLVDHHQRLLHQGVFGHQTLEEARHLIGSASGAGRHDELHGLARFPRCSGPRGEQGAQQRTRAGEPA